jgi:Cu/Ag efflux protein CusF
MKPNIMRAFFCAFLCVGFLLVLTACKPNKPPQPKTGTYPVVGEILSVDPAKQQVTMKHGDIPGLMPAMTMTYSVKDAAAVKYLAPGTHIKGDLVVQDGKADLENIVAEKVDVHFETKPASKQ